jgi:Flp pilus assembly protein TadD
VRIANRWVWLVLPIGVVFFLTALGWGGYELYRVQKQKKAYENAQKALARSAFDEATFWIAKALRDKPNGIDENKLMAELAEQIKSPSVLQWRSRICDLEPNKVRNYLAWAKSAMEMGETPIAEEALRRAPPEAVQNADWHSLNATVLAALGKVAEAEQQFGEAARLDPTDPVKQINLQTLRLASSDAAKAEAARHWLDDRITNPSITVLVSRALLQNALRGSDLASARRYICYLEDNPTSEVGDRLNCLEVRYRDGDYAQALNRLQTRVIEHPTGAPELVYWMGNHQMGRSAIDWVNDNFPLKTRPIEIQVAEADGIASLKDWTLLSQTVGQSNWRGIDFIRRAMLVRSERERGMSNWATDWSGLVKSYDAEMHITIILARLAQSWNWLDEARDLCWKLVDRAAPQEAEAIQRLQIIYQQEQNTAGLFRIAKVQLNESPQNSAFRNNYAFLALLLNLDDNKATQLAEENATKLSDQPRIVATLAFARLRQGRTEEARRVLEQLGDSVLKEPDIALYYAEALNAGPDKEKARQYAEIALGSQNLLPEEREMAGRITRH